MRVLEGLKPERVFYYFEEISKIPHGSTNTKAISDYCVEYAKEHGFEYYQDDSNNVIIIKEAAKGQEDREPIIIQGHLDMVCEQAPDCTKNMETEGLDLFVEGDLIGAKGTTLGGDDGIAIAYALAILEDEEIKHPRLEAVFTVDEEIGMLGAEVIDVSPLKAKTMLNIDSEDEGIFTVSCAGGAVASCVVPVKREKKTGRVVEITIDGLTGGHSGVEIHKKRANANKVMANLLGKLDWPALISIKGGLKDNAIPVACTAKVMTDCDLKEIVESYKKFELAIYEETDPGLSITINEEGIIEENVITNTNEVLGVLIRTPEGVQKMSADVKGLVQTSLNMGILYTEDDNITLKYCVRSSVDSEKADLLNQLKEITENAGGNINVNGVYPGWEYKKDSRLRELMKSIYEEQYGVSPKIEAIHAGVECGMFAGKISGLDCVSYGPDLSEIHTFRERMSIESVQRVYEMTKTIIETI